MERDLYDAINGGRVGEVAILLKIDPTLNINWLNHETNYTALHLAVDIALHKASYLGHVKVVKLLLAQPEIDVNMQDSQGYTLLHAACLSGRASAVHALLEDPRVNASLADDGGRTPLFWASYYGAHEVVKWLIASGKDLGDINRRVELGYGAFTVLEAAIGLKKTKAVSLLERFIANPDQTRYDVSLELGVLPVVAAAHFATFIFLCDGLLRVKEEEKEKESAAARFFDIAQRLPMDLQMTLANRAVGSVKDNVRSGDSEPAFRGLAAALLEEQREIPAKSQEPKQATINGTANEGENGTGGAPGFLFRLSGCVVS